MTVTNTLAVATKSKVLNVKPVSVKPTGIDERKDNVVLMRAHKPDQSGEEEESDGGFEW